MPPCPFVYLSGEVAHDAAEEEEPLEEKFNTTAEWSSGPARPANPTTANGHPAKRKRADTPGNYRKGQVLEMGWLIGQMYYCLGSREASFIRCVPVHSQPWPPDFFMEGGTDSADWTSVLQRSHSHVSCPPTVWCVAFRGFQSQKQKMTFTVVFSLMQKRNAKLVLLHKLQHVCTTLFL